MHARRTFDPEPASAAAVRAFVCETADVDISHPAVLVASELAANAVTHAKTPFTVSIHSDEKIRLAFEDLSGQNPRRDRSGNGSNGFYPGGRGLRLVDALATRWGVDTTPTGKQVWAEVASDANTDGRYTAPR